MRQVAWVIGRWPPVHAQREGNKTAIPGQGKGRTNVRGLAGPTRMFGHRDEGTALIAPASEWEGAQRCSPATPCVPGAQVTAASSREG